MPFFFDCSVVSHCTIILQALVLLTIFMVAFDSMIIVGAVGTQRWLAIMKGRAVPEMYSLLFFFYKEPRKRT